MEGEKKERPQNRNLKPLGSGMLTPEEEYEIRRKSAEATNKKRKRNADIRAAVRAIANLNINGKAKSKDVEKLVSVEDLGESGAPLISQLVYTQFQCALNGDKEARDWICKMLGVDDTVAEAVKGVVQGLAAADPFSGEKSPARMRAKKMRLHGRRIGSPLLRRCGPSVKRRAMPWRTV